MGDMAVSGGGGGDVAFQGDSSSSAAVKGAPPPTGQPGQKPADPEDMTSTGTQSNVATQNEDLQGVSQKAIKGKTETEARVDLNKDSITQALQQEFLDLASDFNKKMGDAVQNYKAGDVRLFTENQGEQIIAEFESKLNDLTQKTIDNLSMGFPALSPPTSNSVIDMKMTNGKTLNDFLAGNAFVAMLIAFLTMFDTLKDQQRVEGKVTVNAMYMTTETSEDQGQAAYESNAAQANKELGQVAVSAVGMATAGASIAGNFKAYSMAKADFKASQTGVKDAIEVDTQLIQGNVVQRNPNYDPNKAIEARYSPNESGFDPAVDGQYFASQPNNPNAQALHPDGTPKTTQDPKEAYYTQENVTPARKEEAAKRIDANNSKLAEMNKAQTSHVLQNMRVYTDQIQMLNQVITQGTQAAGHFFSALQDLEKGKWEMIQAELQGEIKLLGINLDSAVKGRRDAIDQFSQMCQQLVQIFDKISQAVGFTTH